MGMGKIETVPLKPRGRAVGRVRALAFGVRHQDRVVVERHARGEPSRRDVAKEAARADIDDSHGVDAGFGGEQKARRLMICQAGWLHASKLFETGNADWDRGLHQVGGGVDEGDGIRVGARYEDLARRRRHPGWGGRTDVDDGFHLRRGGIGNVYDREGSGLAVRGGVEFAPVRR